MNFDTLDENTFKFIHPFTSIVSGPTKAGKTQWVSKLIKNANQVIVPPPEKIFYFYSDWQPAYNNLILAVKNVEFIQGPVDLSILKKTPEIPKFAIFDDLMTELSKEFALTQLFSKGSHHWNLSCIFIVQNLYFNGLRSARLNTHYLVLFKSPDKQQINIFAKQLYPGNSKKMLAAYNDCISQKFSPLIVDMTTDCPDELRLKANYFDEGYKIIYKI